MTGLISSPCAVDNRRTHRGARCSRNTGNPKRDGEPAMPTARFHQLLATAFAAALLFVGAAAPASARHARSHRAHAHHKKRRKRHHRPVSSASDPTRLFAPDSVWNSLLSPNAPLDPASAAMSADFQTDVASELKQGIGPWIETGTSSTPIYRVGPGTPRVPVSVDPGILNSWRLPLQAAFQLVPIPAGAAPAAGPDAHMTIWQPATDTLWEFFKARHDATGWHAKWGGAIEHVSRNPGYYSTASWPGLSQPNWGATATSLPVAGGVITLDELKAGHIDHALAINLPYPRAGVYAWPAQRSDGTGTDPNAIPEGAHLRPDPTLDLS